MLSKASPEAAGSTLYKSNVIFLLFWTAATEVVQNWHHQNKGKKESNHDKRWYRKSS